MSAFAAEYGVTVEVYETPGEWYNAHGGNVPPDFNVGYRLVQRHGSGSKVYRLALSSKAATLSGASTHWNSALPIQ